MICIRDPQFYLLVHRVQSSDSSHQHYSHVSSNYGVHIRRSHCLFWTQTFFQLYWSPLWKGSYWPSSLPPWTSSAGSRYLTVLIVPFIVSRMVIIVGNIHPEPLTLSWLRLKRMTLTTDWYWRNSWWGGWWGNTTGQDRKLHHFGTVHRPFKRGHHQGCGTESYWHPHWADGRGFSSLKEWKRQCPSQITLRN